MAEEESKLRGSKAKRKKKFPADRCGPEKAQGGQIPTQLLPGVVGKLVHSCCSHNEIGFSGHSGP